MVGLDRAGDIFVSDPVKLEIAAENATQSGPWAWNDTHSFPGAVDRLKLAAQREAYSALFPLRFTLYRAQASPKAPLRTPKM